MLAKSVIMPELPTVDETCLYEEGLHQIDCSAGAAQADSSPLGSSRWCYRNCAAFSCCLRSSWVRERA